MGVVSVPQAHDASVLDAPTLEDRRYLKHAGLEAGLGRSDAWLCRGCDVAHQLKMDVYILEHAASPRLPQKFPPLFSHTRQSPWHSMELQQAHCTMSCTVDVHV